MDNSKKVTNIIFHLFMVPVCIIGTALLVVIKLILWPFRRVWAIYDDLFRSIITNFPHSIRMHLSYFDIFGLRHSVHHLRGLDWRQMLHWEMEQMLPYADEPTVKSVHPNMRMRLLMKIVRRFGGSYNIAVPVGVDNERSLEAEVKMYVDHNLMNATVLGNLTYIAAFSQDDSRREDAYNALCWLRNKMGVNKHD